MQHLQLMENAILVWSRCGALICTLLKATPWGFVWIARPHHGPFAAFPKIDNNARQMPRGNGYSWNWLSHNRKTEDQGAWHLTFFKQACSYSHLMISPMQWSAPPKEDMFCWLPSQKIDFAEFSGLHRMLIDNWITNIKTWSRSHTLYYNGTFKNTYM